MDILLTCDKKLSPFVRKVNVTAGMALNALSNVTVNITSSPAAKSFADVKTGWTLGLNCISFTFNTVKLLYSSYFMVAIPFLLILFYIVSVAINLQCKWRKLHGKTEEQDTGYIKNGREFYNRTVNDPGSGAGL